VGGDLWLLKIDANGDTVWTSTIAGDAEDWGYCVHQTDDGGFAVGGKTWSFGAGQCDVCLIRYGPETGLEEYRGSVPECKKLGATILTGPLVLPVGNGYRIFDIMGRRVKPNNVTRGIYFVEQAGEVVQIIVKVG
jgi:hypothetical protein